MAYPIPANDDAIRAVRLICERIADAVNEGRMMGAAMRADEEGVAEEELAELPMSFAPDEEAGRSAAPPAVPEVRETGEPLPAPEPPAPPVEEAPAPADVAAQEEGATPLA